MNLLHDSCAVWCGLILLCCFFALLKRWKETHGLGPGLSGLGFWALVFFFFFLIIRVGPGYQVELFLVGWVVGFQKSRVGYGWPSQVGAAGLVASCEIEGYRWVMTARHDAGEAMAARCRGSLSWVWRRQDAYPANSWWCFWWRHSYCGGWGVYCGGLRVWLKVDFGLWLGFWCQQGEKGFMVWVDGFFCCCTLWWLDGCYNGSFFFFFFWLECRWVLGNGGSALTVAAWLCCGEADFDLSICVFVCLFFYFFGWYFVVWVVFVGWFDDCVLSC